MKRARTRPMMWAVTLATALAAGCVVAVSTGKALRNATGDNVDLVASTPSDTIQWRFVAP